MAVRAFAPPIVMTFNRGRDFAAGVGPTPRETSTAATATGAASLHAILTPSLSALPYG